MTGTSLDLTPFGAMLTAVGWLYWVLVIGALIVAWRWPKRRAAKIAAVVGVVALAGWMPVRTGIQVNAARTRLDESMALFKKRCEGAGEKITRTIENVDGVLLLNIRPIATPSDRSDPNWPDAALPDEGQGDWYVRTFLFWEHHEDRRNARGYLNNKRSSLPGYKFVDVRNADGSIHRYRLVPSETAELAREQISGLPARYAISFVNLAEPSDRARWVAGTKVSITDTQTSEVIAESTWYSIDPGQGGTAGFRSPWGFARTCPDLAKSIRSAPTRAFVDQVLKPRKGE
jgi:hypothetical protein